MKLNRATLKPVRGKDYARLMMTGDWHIGSRQCLVEKIKEYLDWAKNNQCYLLLLGDMIECGLTTSIGDSVYQQKLNPQEQMEEVVAMLMPLRDRIIGLHSGNHEQRIAKTTGIDVSKIMAKELGVPYLGYACWNLIKVGKQNYTIYSTHGSGGARFLWTKLAKASQLASFISADCIAHGHTHSLGSEVVIKQYVDLRSRTVKEQECRIVMTGSFLDWNNGYAQVAGMPIAKTGSPVIKLMAERKHLAVSL